MNNGNENQTKHLTIHPLHFANKVESLVNRMDLKDDDYSSQLVFTTVLATAVAYKLTLPSSAVADINAYVSTNVLPIVDSLIDDVSKYALINPSYLSKVVTNIYMFRYDLVYRPQHPNVLAMLARIHLDTLNEHELGTATLSESVLRIAGKFHDIYDSHNQGIMESLNF